MARQTPNFLKSWPCDTQVAANVALVASPTNVGNASLPANHFVNGFLALATSSGQNTGTRFVGVSWQSADNNNFECEVCSEGIVQIQSSGATITAGDLLAIANTSGQVATISPVAPLSGGTQANWTTYQIIGVALNSVAATAGLLVDVLLQPQIYVGQ